MSLVVTGGSRGIGRAIVLAAVRARRDVVFGYRTNREEADRTVALAREIDPERRCEAVQLDQRDPAACEAFADAARDRLERVEAVVCNAGINRDGLAFSMSDEAWRDVLDTNLSGTFFVARAFLPDLLATGAGRLVMVGSIAAGGLSGQANYAASKAGLVGLSATLAKEYARKGLTSNVVVPGFFDTDLTRASMSDQTQQFWRRFCPAGRMGELDEVAAAVLFLCAPEASFVNGAVLPVTGGLDWSP
ncbi:MAG: SDR family oxidoreductase [Myxococcales bacterium]|nr:SDR family oxidoreductase [Myxococcales bacterium]